MKVNVRQGTGLALLVGLLVLPLSLPVAGQTGSPEKEKVEVKSISYRDLGQFVRGQVGKVVVVDFWSPL